jgi:hypothetical protein
VLREKEADGIIAKMDSLIAGLDLPVVPLSEQQQKELDKQRAKIGRIIAKTMKSTTPPIINIIIGSKVLTSFVV